MRSRHAVRPLAGPGSSGDGSLLRPPGPMLRALSRRAVLVLSVAVLSACGDDDDGGVGPDLAIASVEVSTPVDSLTALDATAQLDATARNAAGEILTGATFEWSSSNADAVSVETSSGLATARGAGSATVTATAGGESGSVELYVVQEVASVAVTPAEWSPGWIGARMQFAAEALDANGHAVADAGVLTWLSGDDAIARVDRAGVATARGEGETEIRAELWESETESGDNPPAGAATVSVVDEGSSSIPDGLVFTVYPARWDTFPAVLVDDRLVFPDNMYQLPPYTTRNDYCCSGVWSDANVAKFEFHDQRIALLTDVVDGRGTFRVKAPYEEWTDLAYGDALDFDLEGGRIGLLQGPGTLRVKEGVHGPWTTLASGGVAEFRLEGNHIAVLRDDGRFLAKEGVNGAWALLAESGVVQWELSGSVIAVLLDDGRLRVKEGVNGAWTNVASGGVERFDIAGSLIVARQEEGALLGKDGFNAPWVTLASGGIADFQVHGNRIAVIRDDGAFLAKDDVNAAWSTLASGGTARVALDGDFILHLRTDGAVRIKRGLHGAWSAAATVSGEVTQLDPIVRRPVAPIRLARADYADAQTLCVQNTGGAYCYPKIEDTWRAAPLYGRFCGDDRPTDEDWEHANNFGPMDPMDYLCLHHDHAPPNGSGWYFWDESIAHRCVVHHGIHNGRLTENGQLLAVGGHYETDRTRWDDAWAGRMANLKEALEVYYDQTSGCDLAAYEESVP